MKKFLLSITMGMSATLFAQDKPFTINGELKNFKSESGVVMMYYELDGAYKADSTQVVQGKYTLTGTVSQPVKIRLLGQKPTRENRGNFPTKMIAEFFVGPGKISVTHVD